MIAGGSAATPKPSATRRIIAATDVMQLMLAGRSTAANSRSIVACAEWREKLMIGNAARRATSSAWPPAEARAGRPAHREFAQRQVREIGPGTGSVCRIRSTPSVLSRRIRCSVVSLVISTSRRG